MEVLGIIPARGGSKAIPKKNLALLAGRPLLAYAADAASESRMLTRSIVSTDDEEIAAASRSLKLQIPFMRPREISRDETPMIEVLAHALEWLRSKESYAPDVVVVLQPTSPLRKAEHVDEGVRLLIDQSADTVVSVIEVPHQFSPGSLMTMVNGKLVDASSAAPVFRRQDKPRFYARNGPAVLVVRSETIRAGRLYGETTLPYVMSPSASIDIDSSDDLVLAEFFLSRR
jgi:CMP-N,N'-diacetyllegionaminic acid synthase